MSRFTYSRDANGSPTAIDYSNGTGLVPAESQRLTYDNADRLTKVCQTVTTCATANQTVWTYDKDGNRLTEKAGAAAIATYTYDNADQLTAITGPGAKTFTYNANGDQITSGADVSTFNAARQTTGTTVGGVATSLAYDGNGNRHTITTGGTPTSELWDTVGGLPNLALERSGAGVVQRRYTYGRGTETLGYTDPVAATQGWYLTDAMGSVANITNSTGVSVATYTYNPFGVARVNTTNPGYTANPLKYTGQHLDPTGNYNLRARQYNPGIGRFTQTDPAPLGAGSAFEGSYVYGGAQPTVMVDPSGLRSVRGVFVDPNLIAGFSVGGRRGVGVPGTSKCFRVPFGKTKCESAKQTQDRTKDLGLDFLEKVAEAGNQGASSNGVAIGSLYVECIHEREDGPCVRSLIIQALELVGGGTVGFQILGGPAQGALFALVDYTTEFARRQLRVAEESIDAANKRATLRVVNRNGNDGPGSVRYWDGTPYVHQKGRDFWQPVGTGSDD